MSGQKSPNNMKYFSLFFLVIAFSKSETSDECGIRNPGGVGFRHKRDSNTEMAETQYGEFPWVAGVLTKEDVDGQLLNIYQCGGALIHPQVVLTSAHCVHQKKDYLIRAGEWDTTTRQEVLEHQDRQVKTVVLHPDFSEEDRVNDIALLFLNSSVESTEHINTVCLPLGNEVVNVSKCFDVGWGGKVFLDKKHKYLTVLSKFEVPIVPRDECQAKLREAKHQDDFVLHESFMCAGGKAGEDICTGGLGSALVCPISGQSSNKYYQAGIVSWGVSCETPIAYTNVGLFIDWIKEMVKNTIEAS